MNNLTQWTPYSVSDRWPQQDGNENVGKESTYPSCKLSTSILAPCLCLTEVALLNSYVASIADAY